ncbi:hypothetical protein BDDG_04173 [Blastomyces dermatitidis ATCC 18188]|uniref:Uncharacterized protein n=1 Tax=Ajellomyces dermatitidis (strain ATCC 18188 / CBS 674.68) TaxID=653446 RepID=F2TDB9_AJEDA|nr:hypothetical protein BDDG_04173 [Blastomyces dermatitidis ATCC 18188]
MDPDHNKGPPPAYEDSGPPRPVEAPPAYETLVSHVPGSLGQAPSTADSEQPTILTIDGKYVVSSKCPDCPLYSLSHELDGYELGAGILVTRLGKKKPDPNSIAQRYQIPGSDVSRQDVFALRETAQLLSSTGGLLIDGRQYLSEKLGKMNKCMTRYGYGWTARGDGLPSLEARPVLSARRRSSDSEATQEADGQFYEWRLKGKKTRVKSKAEDKDGILLAIETRRRWDTKNKVEINKPTVELKTDIDALEKAFLDFFIAAWCMHNWREAKDITKESLTWDEFKEQARVTRRKHAERRRRNIGGFGVIAAGAIF